MTSYISLIKSFHKLRKETHLSSYAADLYYILLEECNKGRWENPFSVSSKSIIAEAGMSRPTFVKAQKELSKAGLLEIQTSNNPKNGSIYTLLLVNDIDKLLVNDIYKFIATLVNELYKLTLLLVNDIDKLKKENPPKPPKENNNIYYQDGVKTRPRTREGRNFIDDLKRDPLWREEAMRACAGVEDSLDSLYLRVVQQWEAFGEDFNARDARKRFRNWLIKEAESLRQERLTQVSRPPIEERRKAFQMEIADVRSQRLDADNRPLYNVRICNDFFSYWTETAVDAPDVMRFEREAFWETSKRLAAWKEREKTRL